MGQPARGQAASLHRCDAHLVRHGHRTLTFDLFAECFEKENGLDLVLIRDQTTVLYAEKSLDVTAELIGRYDKKFQ